MRDSWTSSFVRVDRLSLHQSMHSAGLSKILLPEYPLWRLVQCWQTLVERVLWIAGGAVARIEHP